MTITEMYHCKGKAGYIDGTPYGNDTNVTGTVQCMGFSDYVHVNEISGELTRVCQIAVRYRYNDKFMRTCFVDRKYVRLV